MEILKLEFLRVKTRDLWVNIKSSRSFSLAKIQQKTLTEYFAIHKDDPVNVYSIVSKINIASKIK